MAGRLDAVLLGLVGGVGAVRQAVHRAHFQRAQHSRTDFRRAADPLGFTLAWLSIFGNTAISLVLEGGQAILGQVAQSDPPMAVFKLFEYLPIPS